MLTQMQITILPGAACKNPCYLHGLPQLPPCYCTAERPLAELSSSKLILSYQRIGPTQPLDLARSAFSIGFNISLYDQVGAPECKRVTVGSRSTSLRTAGALVVCLGLVLAARLLRAGGSTSKWLQ